MTKRTSRRTTRRTSETRSTTSRSRRQSAIGTILGVIVLVIGIAIFQFTGIDVFGVIDDGTRTPVTLAPTTPTVIPTTIPIATRVANAPTTVTAINVPQGFGAAKSFWQVYFTAPTGSRDASTYTGGIDLALADAINAAQRTIDMAAYEFNNPILTNALLAAAQRGVQVRIVTDDEDGWGDEDSTLPQLNRASITIVTDERSALMHNKFTIIDSTTVWTGSWNYTINDTYRNNNNAIALRSRQAVQNFQAEFDEMFVARQFGPRSPSRTPNNVFTQDGIQIETDFAPEDEVTDAIIRAINSARSDIRFMTFSFTVDEIADAIGSRAERGVEVQGIFETVGSETEFSELRPLFCGGLDVRQDGNSFILHHKVFIIDDHTVVTGSFNISANATNSNDENLLVITDRDLAAQFIAEFDRRWREARRPQIGC